MNTTAPPDVEFLRRLCAASDATGCRVGVGPVVLSHASGRLGVFEWAEATDARILYCRDDGEGAMQHWTIRPTSAVLGSAPR